MTLASSSPANAVTAATGPQPDGDRSRELRHEHPDLGALEALLADPATVSSEETAPAGFIAERSSRGEAGVGAIGPFESRTDDSLVDAVHAMPTHVPGAPGESERTVNDGLAAHPPIPAESPVAPIEHDNHRAETIARDGTAGAATEEHDSSRLGADVGTSPVVPRDISEHDTSAEDPSAGNPGAGDTSALPASEAVQTETNAGPSLNEHGNPSGGFVANVPDGTAAGMAADEAASLDDTLLREMAEAPSVSNDSAASDKVDAVFLALASPVQESNPATGTDTPDGLDIESLFDDGARGPEATDATDALEAASLGFESEVASAARPIGGEEANRSMTPSRIGASAIGADRTGGDCTDSVALLTGSGSAGSSTARSIRERPEECGDPFTASVSLPEQTAPAVESSTAPLETDEPSAEFAAVDTTVGEGTADGSDAGDVKLQGPAEAGAPGAASAR